MRHCWPPSSTRIRRCRRRGDHGDLVHRRQRRGGGLDDLRQHLHQQVEDGSLAVGGERLRALVHRFGRLTHPGRERAFGGTFPLDRFGDRLPAKPFGSGTEPGTLSRPAGSRLAEPGAGLVRCAPGRRSSRFHLHLLLLDYGVEVFDCLFRVLRGRAVSCIHGLAKLPEPLSPLRGQPADLAPEAGELDPCAAVSGDRPTAAPARAGRSRARRAMPALPPRSHSEDALTVEMKPVTSQMATPSDDQPPGPPPGAKRAIARAKLATPSTSSNVEGGTPKNRRCATCGSTGVGPVSVAGTLLRRRSPRTMRPSASRTRDRTCLRRQLGAAVLALSLAARTRSPFDSARSSSARSASATRCRSGPTSSR